MSSKERILGISIGGKLGKKKLKDQDNKDSQYSPDTEMPVGAEIGSTSTGQKMTKSSSLSSINNTQESDGIIVDQDDILTLTQDVKLFSDGLAHLKTVFSECTESAEDLRVMSHSRLGEVLCTLKNILHRYPALQSTELFAASGALISKIKAHNYAETSNPAAEQSFCEAIDQLALAFSSSVSEYLMGDLENSFQEKEEKKDRTKSYDNLLTAAKVKTKVKNAEQVQDGEVEHLTPDDIDTILFRLQAGVDLALQRAKAWSKYMKDIASYIERKAQLESEYSKNVMRLAQGVRPVLTEEGFLPLQSVYCTVLSQDTEYAQTCQATQTLLQTSKFVEPLTNRRAEHDKMRKVVKDSWMKEMKKMHDAVHSLRKAQAMYMQRQQDYEKAKEQSSKIESDMLGQSSSSALNKVDKRKKMEEDAMHKAAEAETTYKACVAEANSRQQELDKTKSDLLAKIREQIVQCDQVIKSVTVDYFHLLQTVTAPVPVQYHTLCETSKQYEVGIQYGEFVRRLSMTTTNAPANTEPFLFEPYTFSNAREVDNRKTSTQSTGSSSDIHSQNNSPTAPHKKDRYRVKAWGQGLTVGSDTDSASGSSKSVESSPSNSPHPSGRRNLIKTNSLDGLEEADGQMPTGLLQLPGSEGMDLQGLLKRHGRRRNTTFGVDFQEQVEHCRSAVPPIITKCLKEVERRGISVKGIYRVSGVKSKVEGLCSKFEKDPDSVSVEDEHPNVISNVLKLYLRQLPEPLLTFKLYHCFIQIAKEDMAGSLSREETVIKLGDLASKLPYSNFKTCAMLMHHLNRVSENCGENQMTASNLGIVFGPTLLRPLEGTGSLASLVDTPHQTRTVELLIVNVRNIFGPETEHELIPGETPIEQLLEESTSKAKSEMDKTAIEKPVITKDLEKKDKSPKQSTSNSGLSSDRPVEQLIQTSEGDKGSPKASEADFLLPGSAHTDKKDSSHSPTVTISEGEDGAELDIHSDDDLPDTLLPDDSNPSQHANQKDVQTLKAGKPVIDPRFYGLSPIKEEIQRVTISGVASGKPCPPQQLFLPPGKSSPGSSKKMLVPRITVIESSPVNESQPQMCYPLKASDKPRFSKAHALQNLKAIGPSLQSFVIATAKGLKANFPSSSKSDSTKEKKNKSSPPLQREPSMEQHSAFSLQKSPKLSHQSSVTEGSRVSMSPKTKAKKLSKHSSLPTEILESSSRLEDFSYSAAVQTSTPTKQVSQSQKKLTTKSGDSPNTSQEDTSTKPPTSSLEKQEIVQSPDKASQPLKISSVPADYQDSLSSLISSKSQTDSVPPADIVNLPKQSPSLSDFRVPSPMFSSKKLSKESSTSSPFLSRKSMSNTSPVKSPSILRQSGSCPSVSSAQYSLEFSPPFTRCSKVSFSLPEDSMSEPESSLDSSQTSSMSSLSLSSPWSSPTISRPVLYRQGHTQSDPNSPPSTVNKPFSQETDTAFIELAEQNKNDSLRSDGIATKTSPSEKVVTSSDVQVTSGSQTDLLSPSSIPVTASESTISSTLAPPFKSSISSSSLLLSSLSPVLPRSYSGSMRPTPSLHGTIIAGNLPSGPNKTLTPLVSLPQAVAKSSAHKFTSSNSTTESRYSSAPDLRPYPAASSLREIVKTDKELDIDALTGESSVTDTSENISKVDDSVLESDTEPVTCSLQIVESESADSSEQNKTNIVPTEDKIVQSNPPHCIVKQEDIPVRSQVQPTLSLTDKAVSTSKDKNTGVRAKGTRTTPQTSKSAVSLDPGRTAKGPSGIVMGKAAIMPGRSGAHRTGISSTNRKPNTITTVPSTKSSSSSKCRGSTPVTSANIDSAAATVSSSVVRKTSGTGVSTSAGMKRKPQGSISASHGVSCVTCGRRRSSAKDAQTAKASQGQSVRKVSSEKLHEKDVKATSHDRKGSGDCAHDRKGSADNIHTREAEGTKGSNGALQVRRGSTGGVKSPCDKVSYIDTSHSLDNLQTIGESSAVTEDPGGVRSSKDDKGSDECSDVRNSNCESKQSEKKLQIKQKPSSQRKKSPNRNFKSQETLGQEVKRPQGHKKFHDQCHGAKPATSKSGVMKDRTPRFV